MLHFGSVENPHPRFFNTLLGGKRRPLSLRSGKKLLKLGFMNSSTHDFFRSLDKLESSNSQSSPAVAKRRTSRFLSWFSFYSLLGFVSSIISFACIAVLSANSGGSRLSFQGLAALGLSGSLISWIVVSRGILQRAGTACAKALERRDAALVESETSKAESEAARRAKRRNESLMASILAHSKDMVLLLEPDGSVRFAGGDLALAGFPLAKLEGQEFFSLLADDAEGLLHASFLRSLHAGEPSFIMAFSLKRADGKNLHVEMHIANQISHEDIAGVLVNLKDVSREKHAEERAEFYANFDTLTRLLNKDGFMLAVERAINVAENRGRIFAVMAIGVDRFIRVNDMHGTAIGDKILTDIAQRLRLSFREDDVLARYRGDKFFVLFPELKSPDNINDILDKARSAFTLPFAVEGLSIVLTASFGLSIYPNDGKEGAEIVRNAETALYMAKESGRDVYRLYDSKLNGQILERQKIEADLAIAIKLNQFEPFFQPKVNRDGYIVGAEALVRWRLPSGEIKPPGYFIDVAEKSGSIDKIGALMLNMTCDSIASWKKRGLTNVPVSVNLSTRQFAQDCLVGDIETALRLSGIHPSLIELEITESGIMENEKEGIKKLLELRKLGVSVSIDDFGTGYSSFSKLKDYPIDTVKMDKTFVDPLPNDRRASIIASAIVDLAHTLSFSVVAEGVEKHEQLRFLDTIFCDSFQGYLFSKPVPEADYAAMLANARPLNVK